jgi:phosphoserine phosphatase
MLVKVARCAVVLALALTSCGESKPELPECRPLDAGLTWHGTNRDQLDAMMKTYGRCSSTYDAAKKPLAAFDWDNTVIKNDAGDATFFYMLAHDQLLQPPQKNWRLTSPFLSGDAVGALEAACAALAEAGAPLPTSSNAACAKEILTVYTSGKTTTGKAAWSGWNYRRMEPAYAWVAQLLAGHTRSEVLAFANAAMAENLANPVDTKQTIGGTSVTHWVRVYDQMKDLIARLQENGFDVWVVSASPQLIIEAWAQEVGIGADHVIGIRTLEVAGKLDYNLQGCGDVPDGTNDGHGNVTGNSLITYIDGKRCWINKAIHGDKGATALDRNADARKLPVFAAGDSDTDITFVKDATGLKLAINRNKTELMCNAYADVGGGWIINPMFIQPRAQQTSPYPCSTSACKSDDGVSSPCVGLDGANLPDQADTVF